MLKYRYDLCWGFVRFLRTQHVLQQFLFFIDLMKNLHPVLILKLRKPAFSQDAFDQQLMALLNDRTLSLQKELCTSVWVSSRYPSKTHLDHYCSAEWQHVFQCEISTPSKALWPVALWNISMREYATQAQLAAISPQPLALSYAAKHGTPGLIKHSFEITTGRSNYSR